MADNADEANISVPCPSWAPVLGFMGCTFAVVFASEYCIVSYRTHVVPQKSPMHSIKERKVRWTKRNDDEKETREC